MPDAEAVLTMRILHFTAMEPEGRAHAVAQFTWDGLRPYMAFLVAAKRAAADRQEYHKVPWSRAVRSVRIHLTPIDSLFEWTSSAASYRLTGVPAAVDLDALPDRLVVDWGAAIVRIVSRRRIDDGIVLELEHGPPAAEAIAWERHVIELRAIPSEPPTAVFAETGTSIVSRRAPPRDDKVRSVVADASIELLYDGAGQRLPARRLEWNDGLGILRGATCGELPYLPGQDLELSEPPRDPTLVGDNGVRCSWTVPKPRWQGRGEWVQLHLPAKSAEDLAIDPRAALCEDGVREVRVEVGRGRDTSLRVLSFRRESWQLLVEQLPPEGSLLKPGTNAANLERQRQAVDTLRCKPLPAHRGLLRLLEHPDKVTWPPVWPAAVDSWFLLKDPSTDGTSEQREFVAKAIATSDFAFLEGPPGSGKTHAICELILQLIERGQRVLLCSTTHVAVDNVLERLVGAHPQVEAVRIGTRDDERVRECRLDHRVRTLVDRWSQTPDLASRGAQALEAMATHVVLATANLTCGTTTGIQAHPALARDAHKSRQPWFDVLIIDEASKTTVQEFIVPALVACRWIIVGDVRQLPPFGERRDLEASLAQLSDEPERGKRVLLDSHVQRACLLWFFLTHRAAAPGVVRWCIVEVAKTLDALADQRLAAPRTATGARPLVVRVVRSSTAIGTQSDEYREVRLDALEHDAVARIWLAAADWVLLEPELVARCAAWLPADICLVGEVPNPAPARWFRRHAVWADAAGRLDRSVRDRAVVLESADDVANHLQRRVRQETWASEVAWRIDRRQQLRTSKSSKARVTLDDEIAVLRPATMDHAWVAGVLDDLTDVGLRSVIEGLQLGRAQGKARRPSALTAGLPMAMWNQRAVLLRHQHRMHPTISAFPRKIFYEDKALQDANTLVRREQQTGWQFGAHLRDRRIWVDVAGQGAPVNRAEVAEVRRLLDAWRSGCRKPNVDRDGRPVPWQVACLAFFHRQEVALRDMLRELTGQRTSETRFALPHTEIVCGTVDRFQGREADMVLLSLRNTDRPGHLDVPNRLNVAITRARHLLVIFGKRPYFMRCGVEELEDLAHDTPVGWPGWS